MAPERSPSSNQQPSPERLKAVIHDLRAIVANLRMADSGMTALGCANNAYLVESVAKELEALSSGVSSSAEGEQARLLELAEAGAILEHNYYTEGIQTLSSGGHSGAFSICPHPDCVLVRASSSPSGADR